MSEPKLTALEIFKHLNKSNCRDCGLPTCMAFASMIIQKQKKPKDCPHLDPETLARFNAMIEQKQVTDLRLNEVPSKYKQRIAEVDFAASLKRLGARLVDDMLAVPCLGREFLLDPDGELHAQCHANFWVHVPLLNYVYLCKGRDLTGDWQKYDQLKDAMSYTNYFTNRCEAPLKTLADRDEDLFFDILKLLGGQPAQESFSSDRAVVIYPLPRVPFLICYWRPVEEFESQLSVYLDRATNDNLDMEALYVLGLGIAEMLDKIADRHGRDLDGIGR